MNSLSRNSPIMGLIDNAISQIGTNKLDSVKLGGRTLEEVKESARDFEAVFLTQMMQHMFKGVETNKLLGGGHGEDVVKTLLFDEYGKTISKAGGVGIAESVQRELIKLQGGKL